MKQRYRYTLVAIFLVVELVAACGTTSPLDVPLQTPDFNSNFDYQIGGGYDPALTVRTVVRDREDNPSVDHYNICYINGFQTQPHEIEQWLLHEQYSGLSLLVREEDEIVIVPGWNEAVLDISTVANRTYIFDVVAMWIEECAQKGFAAIEFDNLDSYTRYDSISEADAIEFMAGLSIRTHQHGMASAQKNALELAKHRHLLGTDFAIVESCALHDECEPYRLAYSHKILMIEYEPEAFTSACEYYGEHNPIVLRDRDVAPDTNSDHVFQLCSDK